jgi:hypothetical protein
MGSATSALRTADQTDACLFMNSTSANYLWNQAAIDLAAARGFELSDNAHLLATMNLAIADAIIACWDAKYEFEFWRPVTAIQLADEPLWTPLFATPAHPEYTSGHSSASSAAATVLADYFGDDTPFMLQSPAAPGWVGSIRVFPPRWTRSPMPAYLLAFTSEPPAKMAQSLVAMWPLISWKIRWVASAEKATSHPLAPRARYF